MTLNKSLLAVFLGNFLFVGFSAAVADERGTFSIRPYIGLSKGEESYPASEYVVKSVATGEVTDTGTSSLSAGGGLGVGIDVGYRFSSSINVVAGYAYRANQEVPNISDVTAMFSQQELHAAIHYSQALNNRIRWYVGPGFAYHISPRYEYKFGDLDYEFVYENTVSPMLELGGEVMTDEGMALSVGIRFHLTEYTGKDVYVNGEKLAGFVPNTTNGNGVDVNVAATWYFGK